MACGVSLAALGGLSGGRLDRSEERNSEQDSVALDLAPILKGYDNTPVSKGGGTRTSGMRGEDRKQTSNGMEI